LICKICHFACKIQQNGLKTLEITPIFRWRGTEFSYSQALVKITPFLQIYVVQYYTLSVADTRWFGRGGMRCRFAMNPMLHRTILRKSISFATYTNYEETSLNLV